MPEARLAEPWLREVSLPCDPAIAAVLFALEQVAEDLERFVPPRSAYFHLRHIAQSLDRLTAYLEERPLTEEQLASLAAEEKDAGETWEFLVQRCQASLERTRGALLRVPASQFGDPRYIGRKRIRTTAIGLIVHIAEHTQRHMGELIAYSRVG